MTCKRKDRYTFCVSKGPKKYDVYNSKGSKITSFGAKGYTQYFDKIGAYAKGNHKNVKRKAAYYARHGKNAKFESAKWFSHRYLW